MRLRGLSPAKVAPATEIAQRFLASAYDSVEAVLESLEVVRAVRARSREIRGRLPANEEDLLRATIVFAGAGLDATLKQLIRDALPSLLEVSPQAHDKFETFVSERLRNGESADPKLVARYLASPNPRARLIDDYIFDLTGSSLQAAEEVQRVAGALGIDGSVLRKRISELKSVFVARNEISHELDLQRPERQGDRARRTRRMQQTIDLAHEALDVAQLIVNAVVDLLT